MSRSFTPSPLTSPAVLTARPDSSPDATPASGDQTVILWDVDSRQPLATLEGHKGAVYGVAFSPDGKRLASGSLDQTVILWDVDSRKPLATLEGHKKPRSWASPSARTGSG